MAIGLCEANKPQQSHRARRQDWRRAGERLANQFRAFQGRVHFELELHVSAVVQRDTGYAADDKERHSNLYDADRHRAGREGVPRERNQPDSEQDHGHVLQRALDMPNQQQFEGHSSHAEEQRSQKHSTNGGERVRLTAGSSCAVHGENLPDANGRVGVKRITGKPRQLRIHCAGEPDVGSRVSRVIRRRLERF
jgi:hypothetical protein